jgi:hypothetical protein
MKLLRNRPLIEAGDHPLSIFNALQEQSWYDSLYDGDKTHLHHKSQNAWETIENGFELDRFDGTLYKPDGQALILDFGVDDLEFALVYYGCRLLSDGDEIAELEVEHINQLLMRIDVVKGLRQAVEST